MPSTITLATPTPVAGASFLVSGTRTATPVMQYKDASGAFVAMPVGSHMPGGTSETFSFTHPSHAAGSFTLTVEDDSGGTGSVLVTVPVSAPTPSGFPTVTPGVGSITLNNGQALTVTSDGRLQHNGVDYNGGSGTSAGSYDTATNSVYGQDATTKKWYIWVPASGNFALAGVQPVTSGVPPTVTPGNFTVTSTGGFISPTGVAWSYRGLNASPADLATVGIARVLIDYPNLTMIRVTCDSGSDTAGSLATLVASLTAAGVVAQLEDHSGNQSNTAWYVSIATAFKTNSHVFLECPNEPTADAATTAANQIAIINGIRGAGFSGPVGIQPVGGFDLSNVPTVTASVGTVNLFCTPHIYYGVTPAQGGTASGPADYANGQIAASLGFGLFPCIDEFGDAIDGFTRDDFGPQVITAVTALNLAGKCGATFWAMDNDNHADGADSAFLTPDGLSLTSVGTGLKSWI